MERVRQAANKMEDLDLNILPTMLAWFVLRKGHTSSSLFSKPQLKSCKVELALLVARLAFLIPIILNDPWFDICGNSSVQEPDKLNDIPC